MNQIRDTVTNQIKDPESFAVTEPRIRQIAHELQRLLSIVELEKDGQPVEVNGFRLKDLSQWADSRIDTAMNALTPISSLCNSRCLFCFEEGIPYPRERSLMSFEEAKTRLKYFVPETGQSLFPSNRNHMETFIHPQAVEIIEMARQRQPGRLFWITTNGSHFTEQTVARLAKLKPLIFKLSLNAVDPQLNQQLMHTGSRTETAINAPKLLQKYRIPFMGSIVAWPTLPLEAIENTVHYLESCQAYAVRIRLPLTHKYLRQQLDCNFNAHWETIAKFADELRHKVKVALFVEPPIYWVNPIVPEVDGVVLNSPAYRAGVRAGDIIRTINGQSVSTRVQSEALLDQCHMQHETRVELVVERQGREQTFLLEELPASVDTYPYDFGYFYRGENYGIFHVEDFHLKDIQAMFDVIQRYQAKNVLLFSSAIAAPIFETLVNQIPGFREQLQDINIFVDVVEENSAGGNYDIMDSRFVEDYGQVIRKRIEQGAKIDLVLIPDAFGSSWGMDITGISYQQISLETGIPVERIRWFLIYGREV